MKARDAGGVCHHVTAQQRGSKTRLVGACGAGGCVPVPDCVPISCEACLRILEAAA